METTILKIKRNKPGDLLPAAGILQSGGLVAFPTETVYGLGAIYNDEPALLKVFAVKGRPADNPLILHIYHLDQLGQIVSSISPAAERLIQRFWPGPLTLIFPKKANVSPVVTANLNSVAVRMPSHPVAQELLRLTGIPVAAPSANLSGKPSPTNGEHVINDLLGKIEMIIDAGPCPAGVESTVLSLMGEEPIILRPGTITREELETVLGKPVLLASGKEVDRPQAPGMKYRHYAPEAPVTLFEGDPGKIVLEINRRLAEKVDGQKIVVLGTTENIGKYDNEWVLDLGPQGRPEIIASNIYDLLRFCDRLNADSILIEGITDQGIGTAVINRLRKAAGGNVINVS
ncbi:MAG: threonylcarbamoyl-AMP synthase [Firmicutes bacterium]|nr:threonylcarbamoyl-AMP synthase [Bacillota bacterium]